ncbi:MAG: lipid-binding SYLF domain-containing protein [Magnetospirillum sp. WYHS-4]
MKFVAMLALGLAVLAGPASASDRLEAEALVEKARFTIEGMKESKEEPYSLLRSELKKAQGVMIFPSVLKAGFFFGAEGGSGVLVAKDASGNWGYPAFYTMGAGSFGLQFGGQAAEIVLVLRTKGAVDSIIKHQGKLGADIEATVANIGAGMEASTTSNLGADILAFSRAAGLYGGGSIEGSVLARRNDWNDAFYGSGATPETIVQQGRYSNPAADRLRTSLAR